MFVCFVSLPFAMFFLLLFPVVKWKTGRGKAQAAFFFPLLCFHCRVSLEGPGQLSAPQRSSMNGTFISRARAAGSFRKKEQIWKPSSDKTVPVWPLLIIPLVLELY